MCCAAISHTEITLESPYAPYYIFVAFLRSLCLSRSNIPSSKQNNDNRHAHMFISQFFLMPRSRSRSTYTPKDVGETF